MIVNINVPDYSKAEGLKFEWDINFAISVRSRDGSVHIQANRPGLISLARHLLMLAQDDVPYGHHFHLDEMNSLEDHSCELIIEKVESLS
jgi:hypothetical protein